MSSEFYERYWQRPRDAIPERGLLIEQRKKLLKAALANLPSGSPILDAGCGTGEFSLFISSLGFTPIGVDISATAVAQARLRCPGTRFEVASPETRLPFIDEEFAAVWCSEVLEHLFDVHAALAELNRVLRPGGILVLTTPYHGLFKNIAIGILSFERHYNPYLSHIRFFSRPSLAMCLERAGFATIQWQGIGRHWPVWKSQFVVSRKVSPPRPAPDIVG